MKKLIIILLVICMFEPAWAQRRRSYGVRKSPIKWLSIAPKAGYGVTLLMNSTVFNDPHIIGEKRSPAYFIGGRIGFTHGDNFGISFEGGKSQFVQKYTALDINNLPNYSKSYEFSTIEYGALLRLTSDLGFIFEAGPRIVKIQKAYSNAITNPLIEPSTSDILEHVNTKYTSIVIGIGQSLFRGDRTELNLSLKASYSVSDLFTENYLYIRDNEYNEQNKNFVENYVTPLYSATHPFTLMATIEFNYFFAFWGDASCGKGRFMMFK